jgi:tripartite-type tricarboxylate transporter receptor subunit TctC
MFSRRATLGLAAGLAPSTLGIAAAARAQSAFPERPVRLVVPFPPGGLTDTMARLVAERLGHGWGRAVLVENRAGGNALIGADAVAKSPPDGYTMLAATLTLAVNVTLFPNAPYDFVRDLAPVALLGSLPLIVVVNPSSPARSLDELVALARTRPLNSASSGNGTPPHLGLELLRRSSGLGGQLTHVPYRGGAPATTDLVAGNVDMMVGNLPEVLEHVRGGRLRALALCAAARHPLLPDVPTTAEAGMPQLVLGNWVALMVPAATPAAVRTTLEAATLAAIRDPELVRRGEAGGFEILGWDTARTQRHLAQEVQRWAAVIAEAGIKAD